MTTKATLRSIARLLLIIGGIILILEAVLHLREDIRNLLNLAPRIPSLDFFTSSIVSVLVRVLALVGAGKVSSPAWGIILLVLGFLLIGSLCGLLVFVGALLDLVA